MNNGKIIRGTGKVFGSMLELNLLLTGAVIGGIVIIAGNKKVGKTIKNSGKALGKFAGKASEISANLLAEAFAASRTQSYQLGKAIGKRAVQSRIRIYGDPKQFFDSEKVVEASYRQTK